MNIPLGETYDKDRSRTKRYDLFLVLRNLDSWWQNEKNMIMGKNGIIKNNWIIPKFPCQMQWFSPLFWIQIGFFGIYNIWKAGLSEELGKSTLVTL